LNCFMHFVSMCISHVELLELLTYLLTYLPVSKYLNLPLGVVHRKFQHVLG